MGFTIPTKFNLIDNDFAVAAGNRVHSGSGKDEGWEALVLNDRWVRATRMRQLVGWRGSVTGISTTWINIFENLPVVLSTAQSGDFVIVARIRNTDGNTTRCRVTFDNLSASTVNTGTSISTASASYTDVVYTWTAPGSPVADDAVLAIHVELSTDAGSGGDIEGLTMYEADLASGDL